MGGNFRLEVIRNNFRGSKFSWLDHSWCRSGNDTHGKADNIIRNLTANLVHMVLTKERFSVGSCMRGYQAGATILGYFLLHGQREVQASLVRLRLRFCIYMYFTDHNTRAVYDRGPCE